MLRVKFPSFETNKLQAFIVLERTCVDGCLVGLQDLKKNGMFVCLSVFFFSAPKFLLKLANHHEN